MLRTKLIEKDTGVLFDWVDAKRFMEVLENIFPDICWELDIYMFPTVRSKYDEELVINGVLLSYFFLGEDNNIYMRGYEKNGRELKGPVEHLVIQ